MVRGPAKSAGLVDAQLRVSSDRSGIGLQVTESAAATLDNVAIIGAWGFGAYVQSKGTLSAKHTFIDQTHSLVSPAPLVLSFAVGITADDNGQVTLDTTTIEHGALAAISAGSTGTVKGTGLYLRDIGEAKPLGTGAGISVGQGGKADLVRSAIASASGVAVLAVQGGGASIHLGDSAVHGTRVASTGFGHGAAGGVDTTFSIDGSFFFDNAAIAIALAGCTASIKGTTLSRNAVALQVQDGSFIVESDDDPTTSPLGAGEVRISADTKLVDNVTRIGNGIIPLPKDVLK